MRQITCRGYFAFQDVISAETILSFVEHD